MHYQDCNLTRSHKIKQKNLKIHFFHLVETDVSSLDRMAAETRHDPGQSRLTSRTRKNVWGNCSQAERPYKEIRHKLTIEHGVICNRDLVIHPKTKENC